MEKIITAVKFGGEVNAFIGNILDPIIEGIEFFEEIKTFVCKYAHEHPDEIDELNFEIKSSICGRYHKKKLQSGEDEILFKKKYPQPEDDLEVDRIGLEHNYKNILIYDGKNNKIN